jgi:hypothetical protein
VQSIQILLLSAALDARVLPTRHVLSAPPSLQCPVCRECAMALPTTVPLNYL